MQFFIAMKTIQRAVFTVPICSIPTTPKIFNTTSAITVSGVLLKIILVGVDLSIL